MSFEKGKGGISPKRENLDREFFLKKKFGKFNSKEKNFVNKFC